MAIIKDDRTAEEVQKTIGFVIATDSFMSGWGKARKGSSKVAWACKLEHVDAVMDWVESRDEMNHVNVVKADKWEPGKYAHLSVYVVNEGHSSLG